MSDSLQPHGCVRMPDCADDCPPLSPKVCSNSCPLSQWCYLTISSSALPSLLPSIFPSIRVFPNASALFVKWPNYWIFSFSISPSNEYSGLISFRIDWLDLLAVQGTLKSLLQHLNMKASVLQQSAFFMVHLSHLSMTAGKTVALTIQIFVGKVIALLFNMLFRFVIAFLPRSKCLLISWLQSPTAVIFESTKTKHVNASTFSSSICHEVMGPDAMILVFWMLSFKPPSSLSSFTFINKLFCLLMICTFFSNEFLQIFGTFPFVILKTITHTHNITYINMCNICLK